MKSKKIICTLALTTVILGGSLISNVEAATISSNRISGNNRYETSQAISQSGWTNSDTVVLTSGEQFPDALSAGPLAKKYNAPILLTSSQSISTEIMNELSRLKAKNIIIIGGIGSVSANIENELKSKGYTTDRIGGKDRYETSAMIAARLDNPSAVVIASGEGFPDALAISTIASKLGMPILLSPKGGLSEYAKNYIAKNNITKTYIVGGTGVLSADIEKDVPSPTRLNGQDRYGTNLAVIKAFESDLNYDKVYLTSDQSFADALSGAALASNSSSPIILTNGSINNNINDYLKGKINVNSKAIALGGTAVVSDSLIENITTSPSTGGDSSGSTTSNIQDLSDGGSHVGDYVISTGGTFGDSVKTTSISGNVSINDTDASSSDKIVLQNMNIIGSLNVDFGAGTVTLNNVTVNGINVTNVGSNSLHVKGNSVIESLTVNDPNNDAHIVVEDNAMIAAATVLSGANLEVAATATNAQAFSNITLAPKEVPTASNQVMLTGTFDTVNVTSAAKVVLAPSSEIKTQIIAKAPLEFTAPITAKVSKVNIQPSKPTDTFVLSGNLDNVNVSAVSNVQVQSGTVKVSSDTNAAVKVTVAENATVNTVSGSAIATTGLGTVVTREKSAEAKVTSIKLGNGKVNEYKINDLPQGINARKLLDNLLVSAFATAQVVDSSGNPVGYDKVIDNTMQLKVTAENGTTVNSYSLSFAALPTFEVNYPKAATGEFASKNILMTIKANQSGRVYMVALPSGAAAPTSAQVKMGTDAAGKFVTSAFKDLHAGVEDKQVITVKEDNKQYDIYVVLAGINGNLQLKPTKLTATSPEASVPDKILKSTEILPDITASCSKEQPNLNLPTEVSITTTDGTSIKAKVIWNEESKNGFGEIVLTGKVELPVGVANPNNVSLMVTQKVIIVATLADLNNEMFFAQNMINIPVGTNVGDCQDKSAVDALISVLADVKAVVANTSATKEEINNAFYKLKQAEEAIEASIITGLKPAEENNIVTANSNFYQAIKVRIAGPGKFVDNLSPSNIKLGGDFAGLTVASVSIDSTQPWEAKVELKGNLSFESGAGTITVNAAGWNGPSGSQDITAKVKVADPNALNLVWPMGDGFIYNNKCINLGFDNDIQIPKDWSKITIKNVNGVQVPITGVYNVGSTKELGIECSSIVDGQYMLTIPENTVVDAKGEKYNKAINIKFNIKLGNADGTSSNNGDTTNYNKVDINTLKNEILNIQNMLNIPVGNNPGDCPNQYIKDELINVITYVKEVVGKSGVTQEEINNVFYKLKSAQQAFMKSIITGLMPAEENNIVTANSDFYQTIKVRMAGPGKFVDNLSPSNISLGGDFAGLTVASVSIDSTQPWEAKVELKGNLSFASGAGTITVNAAGWNGPSGSQDITAKVKVADPNALNLVWPMGEGFIYNNKCINLGFDNDIQIPTDWSQITIKNVNGVQVPITGVYNVGSTKELGIECSSIIDGQYILTIPENTIVDAKGEKYNKAINIKFNIKFGNVDGTGSDGTSSNNVDITILKNEILNMQNMLNIPVGNNPGDCPDQSIKDELINVITYAKEVVGKSSVTQEEINNVFYKLKSAQQVFMKSIITGLMPAEENNRTVTANSDFYQAIKVRIAGPGKFVDNLSPSNISLGGDFAGLTVASVSIDSTQPWEAKVELKGNLSFVSGAGTITVNAAGWNGPSGSQDITAKVKVTDPNALNLVWPMGYGSTYNYRGINLGFDNDIQIPKDWSQIIIKDANGVQVPVTGVHSIGLPNELGIDCASIGNGKYTLTIPENTLVDVNGQKHNKAINITFNIELPNIDISTLKQEISFAQNMVNIPVGTNVGDCPDQSIKDAFTSVLTYAESVVGNSNATQEEINNAFNKLWQAQQEFQATIITGLVPIGTNNTVTANSSFHQTIGLSIAGPGKFMDNLSPSNLILGGDFAGLTVKSISFVDINQPWQVNVELEGNLAALSGVGTVTVNAAGWNSPSGSRDITAKIAVASVPTGVEPTIINETQPSAITTTTVPVN